MIDLRIVLGLVLFALGLGVWSGVQVTKNDVSTVRLEASRLQTEALQRQAQMHNKQVEDLERINDETIAKLETITADNAITADTGDSLQQQFTASMCKHKTASTVSDSAADATTSLVHSYVFSIVNQRAITLAKIADESRYRGLACEAEYAAVTAVIL